MDTILFLSVVVLVAYVWGLRRRAKNSEDLCDKLVERIQSLETDLENVKSQDWPNLVSRVHALEGKLHGLRKDALKASREEVESPPAPVTEIKTAPSLAPAVSHREVVLPSQEVPPAPEPPAPVKVPPSISPLHPAPSTPPKTVPAVPAHEQAGSVRSELPMKAPRPVAPPRRVPPVVVPAPVPAPELTRVSIPQVSKPKITFNLEEMLGANLFTKLGVMLLVIGMTFLLMTQWHRFGPGLKVTIGFLTAALMLVPGILFEKSDRWRLLARAGIGGGWALTFFVTYAMHHIEASRVITSQGVDLVLMLLVGAAMVGYTLKYRSQVVTGLAFFLAFITVTISNVTAFSLFASAILALALVAIVWRMGWYELEIFGILATFLNHYYWLRPIIVHVGQHHRFDEYAASSALLIFYWLLFRVSYVARRNVSAGQERVSTVAALLNLGLFLGIMGYQAVHPPHPFWFFFAVGATELAFGQMPWLRRRRPAFIILTTLGAVLLTAAYPYQFTGGNLSMIWLVDAEAFFLAGVFLREVTFRRLGMLAGLLTAGQILIAATNQVIHLRDAAGAAIALPHLGLVYAVAAIAFYANTQFAPRRWKDLAATPYDGFCFKVTSYVAGILASFALWAATSERWTSVAWFGLVLVLVWAASRLKSLELAIQAHVLLAVSFSWAGGINLAVEPWHRHAGTRLLTAGLSAVLAYTSSRWADGWRERAERRMAGAYTSAASLLVAGLIWFELPVEYAAPALMMLVFVLTVAGNAFRYCDLSYQSHVAAALAVWAAAGFDLAFDARWHGIPLRVVTVGVVVALLYVCARWANVSRVAGAQVIAEAHTWVATGLGAALVYYECSRNWTPVAWCAMALALVWLGARFSRRDLAWQAHALSLSAFAWLLAVNLGTSGIGHHVALRLMTVAISIVLIYLCSFGAASIEATRPLHIREAYTWAGATLIFLLAWYELRPLSVAVAWMIFGLLLFELGFVRRSASLRLQGYVALASSFARMFFVNLAAAGEPGHLSPRVLTVVPLALAFFYVFWRTKDMSEPAFSLDRRMRVSEYHCYLGSMTMAVLARAELDAQWVVAGWAAMLALSLALSHLLNLKIFLHQAMLLGLAVIGRAALYNFVQHSYFATSLWSSRPTALAVTIGFLFLSLVFAFPLRVKEPGAGTDAGGFRRAVGALIRRPEQFLFFTAAGMLTVLLALDLRSGMVTLSWGAEGVSIFLLGLAVGERSFRLAGLSLLLLCVGKIIVVDVWEFQGTDRYLTLIGLGIALLAVSALYTRFRQAIHKYL